MSVKQIVTNEKKLTQICDNNNTVYKPSDERVITDLLDTMSYYTSTCIGLSAPQIGYNARIFVMKHYDGDLMVINPEIIKAIGQKLYLVEGCLSRPGVRVKVGRCKKIRVKYYKLNGEVVERNFTNMYARVFQHELDHLNGILI